MKKVAAFGLLFLIVFIIACVPPEQPLLSDMQITACTAAHDARTCDSRLPEVGIVLQEECCQQLGKCCP
ncbi:TPA: hypothetical protein HA242_03380 [Candidatus Woesearchaeota archaeon]|nr:hypothetical protein [Candidatus Woesearchaeota archaeon]HIG93641.1 hypothetical protein [Candidatus Woesearchaeota archaeon]HIH12739.1 hypothetical protein [Candidatus Woesearchaeota archaeon]